MPLTLAMGDAFPDLTLPDQRNIPTTLSHLTKPSQLDERLGFTEGYPLILVYYRGFFCPRDQEQFRQLVTFQQELAVNYGRLACIGVDPPLVQAAFRAGLGAQWPFLADVHRASVTQLRILDDTEGEYANRAQPFTFVLRPDLTVHRIYNGWYFVGRPTLEELRQDLRAIMASRRDYAYAAYTTPDVRRIRIPQQAWATGAPELGANGLPVASGVVRWFDVNAGVGVIARDGANDEIFFHFTAIPGEGYRTVRAGISVRFEVVENATGLTARNLRWDA
jgi:cold shock CspA family protein/peroxiredoxin